MDAVFIVIFELQVKSKHPDVQAAQTAAQGLVASLHAKQAQPEQEWEKKEKEVVITDKDRDGGHAFIAVRSKDSGEVKVLLSDQSWKMLRARSAPLSIIFGRACIAINDRQRLLARWLLKAKAGKIVDHKNRNPLDNRLDNLRITDRAGNSQNIGQRVDGGWKGVRSVRGKWRVTVKIRGEPRAANRQFDISELDKALELYDLASLHQHKAGAYLNLPDKLEAYTKMLSTDKTKAYLEDFLGGKGKKSSLYKGVYAFADAEEASANCVVAVPTPPHTPSPSRKRKCPE